MTSGYFLGLKLNKVDNTLDQKVIVKSSLKRFLRLYLLFGGWYFICDVIKTVAISHNKVSDLLYLLHRLIVESPGGGIWFVYTIVIGLLILYYISCFRIINLKKLTFFFAGMYIIGSILLMRPMEQSFIFTAYKTLLLTDHNILFNGIFFFGGAAFACLRTNKNNTIIKLASIFVLILYVLYGLFSYDWNNWYQAALFPVFRMLSVFSLLYLCVTTNLYMSKNGVVLRKLSTALYFTHWNFINCLLVARNIAEIDDVTGALITTGLSLILAILIVRVKNGELYDQLFSSSKLVKVRN